MNEVAKRGQSLEERLGLHVRVEDDRSLPDDPVVDIVAPTTFDRGQDRDAAPHFSEQRRGFQYPSTLAAVLDARAVLVRNVQRQNLNARFGLGSEGGGKIDRELL